MKAILDFIEGTIELLVGEVKKVSVPVTNGRYTVIEAGLLSMPWKGELSGGNRLLLFVRNLGSCHQLNDSVIDHTVHPRSIRVRFNDSSVQPNETKNIEIDRRSYNAGNRTGTFIQGSKVYGLRCASFREPCGYQTGFINGEGVVDVICLADRPPTFGYPIYPAQWQSNLTGAPGEDSLSASHHRLPGGHMTTWDVFQCNEQSFTNDLIIDADPMIEPDPKWIEKALAIIGPLEHSPREKKVIESLTKGITTPEVEGDRSFLWAMLNGYGRWATWNWSFDLNKLPAKAVHLHWMSWPDIHWNEGHYNVGFQWPLTLFRVWLETKNEIVWSFLQWWARWVLTGGMCWSTPQAVPGLMRNFRGWSWYESSARGSTVQVGAQYHPSSYKQFTESIMMAHALLSALDSGSEATRLWQEAKDAHVAALLRMGYETWDLGFGERIGGWGMMNFCAVAKWDEDQTQYTRAWAVFRNMVTRLKAPLLMAYEPEGKWKDPDLGLPYIPNMKYNPPTVTKLFGHGKVMEGIVRLYHYGKNALFPSDQELLKRKLIQMVDWTIETCFVENADKWLIDRYQMTSDRIPAIYNNGNEIVNDCNGTSSVIPFLIGPIGYVAAVFNHPAAITCFKKLWAHYGEFLDATPSITRSNWKGIVASTTIDNAAGVVKVTLLRDSPLYEPSAIFSRCGLALVQHDASGNEVFLIAAPIKKVDIDSGAVVRGFDLDLAAMQNHIAWSKFVNNSATGSMSFFVTGPITRNVLTKKDYAIKRTVVDTTGMPNPNRPFDWGGAKHHNAWAKFVGQFLMQGNIPALLNTIVSKR